MQHAQGQTEPQKKPEDTVAPAADDPIEQAQQLVDEMSAEEPEEEEAMQAEKAVQTEPTPAAGYGAAE